MFFDLSSAQSKVYTDTQQTLLAVRDTQARLASTKGGMHWKTISGAEYLYRTLDGKGAAKSLGRRSPETEQIYQSFHDYHAANTQSPEDFSQARIRCEGLSALRSRSCW